MNQSIIFAIISTFIPFLIGIIPRWISPGTRESDSMGDLFLIKEFRKNRSKVPRTFKQIETPGVFNFPYLMYYILSFFPQKHIRTIADYFGPMVFSLNSLLVFLVTYFLTTLLNNQGNLQINAGITALLAAIIYSTTPLLLMQGIGVFNIKSRPLAGLFLDLSYVFMLLFISSNNYFLFFNAILFASLIFLTGRFTVQMLVFSSIIISLFTLKIWFLLLLILGFLTAIFISKRKVFLIFKGHLGQVYLFYKVLAKDYLSKRNRLKDVFKLPYLIIKNPREAFDVVLTHNSYLILLVHLPTIILFIMLINKNLLLFNSKMIFLLLIWFSSSLIIFLLTSLKPLLFLGPAERYVNHGIVPFAVILAIMISSSLNNLVLWILILIVLFELALVGLYYYVVLLTDKYHQDISEGIDWLAKQKKELKVLPIPYNLGAEIAYFTKHITFYLISCPSPPYFTPKIWRHNFIKYPYPNLNKFVKEDKINAVFTYNDSNKSLDKFNYDFSKFKKVYSKGNVNIYFLK